MFKIGKLLWILVMMCADIGHTQLVLGSLVLEISLNMSAGNNHNKIFFSPQSKTASLKIVLNNSIVEFSNMEEDVDTWQELVLLPQSDQNYTHLLTRKNTYGYFFEEFPVFSNSDEDLTTIQVIDAVDLTWVIGKDPGRLFGGNEKSNRQHGTDVAICIIVILLLGLTCYIVYLLHDSKKTIKQRLDHNSSPCSVNSGPQMNQEQEICINQERKISISQDRKISISQDRKISVSQERKISIASCDNNQLSPQSLTPRERLYSVVSFENSLSSNTNLRPRLNLPPPLPPTQDLISNQTASTGKLDLDSQAHVNTSMINEDEEEEPDYDYIDITQLRQYQDKIRKENEKNEFNKSLHDSENSVYEAAERHEPNVSENSESYNHLMPENSQDTNQFDNTSHHDSENSTCEIAESSKSKDSQKLEAFCHTSSDSAPKSEKDESGFGLNSEEENAIHTNSESSVKLEKDETGIKSDSNVVAQQNKEENVGHDISESSLKLEKDENDIKSDFNVVVQQNEEEKDVIMAHDGPIDPNHNSEIHPIDPTRPWTYLPHQQIEEELSVKLKRHENNAENERATEEYVPEMLSCESDGSS